jgi:hypothetical protein
MLQVNSQHAVVKRHSGGVLIILTCCNISGHFIDNEMHRSARRQKKKTRMYQAANENFETRDLWKPGSQAGHLEKLAALVETDS